MTTTSKSNTMDSTKTITIKYSKHLGVRYPNEEIMTDNCGSCDGAMCDYCKKLYLCFGKSFTDFESAKEFADSGCADLLELTGSIAMAERGNLRFYLNSENVLCVLWWDYDKGCNIEVALNTAAKLYPEKLAEFKERKAQWENCPCVDKDDDNIGDCVIYGCNDSRCRHEVNHSGRKEKKWYM